MNSLYENYRCTVRPITECFRICNGFKQGCVISLSLFKIYINDLVSDINRPNAGVTIQDGSISMLMFVDDIVLIAPAEEDLQHMLNAVGT